VSVQSRDSCVADAPITTVCLPRWRGTTTPSLTWDGLAPGDHFWQVRASTTPGGRFDLNGVSWLSTVPPPADHWKAEHFSNATLSGTPTSAVDEGTGFVDHWWANGAPSGLPADNFSARFTRTVTFPAGRYRFRVQTDDGSRLYVDGQLRIDAWWDQNGSVPHEAEMDLAGAHTLRYECYERWGGRGRTCRGICRWG